MKRFFVYFHIYCDWQHNDTLLNHFVVWLFKPERIICSSLIAHDWISSESHRWRGGVFHRQRQKLQRPFRKLRFLLWSVWSDFDRYPYACLNHQLLPLMSREPYGFFGYHPYGSGCRFRPKLRNISEQKTTLFSSNNYLLKTSSLSVILMFIYTFIVMCA